MFNVAYFRYFNGTRTDHWHALQFYNGKVLCFRSTGKSPKTFKHILFATIHAKAGYFAKWVSDKGQQEICTDGSFDTLPEALVWLGATINSPSFMDVIKATVVQELPDLAHLVEGVVAQPGQTFGMKMQQIQSQIPDLYGRW